MALSFSSDADEPISETLDPSQFQTWYYALFLVASNFFYLPIVIRAHKHGLWLVSALAFLAAAPSAWYHSCQTMGLCGAYDVRTMTVIDHFCSGCLWLASFLLIANYRSTLQMRNDLQRRREQMAAAEHFDVSVASTSTSATLTFLPLGNNYETQTLTRSQRSAFECEAVREVENSMAYANWGYGRREPNMLYDAWSVYSTIACIFVMFFCIVALPFSIQAFLLTGLFGLALVFFKVVIIDEGQPLNMYGRVSLPDLLLALLFLVAALICYALDSYCYGVLHSLWHAVGGLGLYFFLIGLTWSLSDAYSPVRDGWRWLARLWASPQPQQSDVLLLI
jgi:hypothetical protein